MKKINAIIDDIVDFKTVTVDILGRDDCKKEIDHPLADCTVISNLSFAEAVSVLDWSMKNGKYVSFEIQGDGV